MSYSNCGKKRQDSPALSGAEIPGWWPWHRVTEYQYWSCRWVYRRGITGPVTGKSTNHSDGWCVTR